MCLFCSCNGMLVCWGLSAENGNYKNTKWSLSNFFPVCLVSMLEQQLRLNITWFPHSWFFLQGNENEKAWEQTTGCTVWCYKKKALIAACEGTQPFFISDLVSVWPRGEITHSPISVGKLFFLVHYFSIRSRSSTTSIGHCSITGAGSCKEKPQIL